MHILVEYSESSLYDSSEADALAQIDTARSAQRYGDLVYVALRARYRAATIKIVLGINDRVTINGEARHMEEPYVSQIVGDVYHGWKWALAA